MPTTTARMRTAEWTPPKARASRRALWTGTASDGGLRSGRGRRRAGWRFAGAPVRRRTHGHRRGGSLGLALFANTDRRRPPSQRASYGYGRAEVLAAFVNAIVMLAVVAAIAIEAVRRLLDPSPVAGTMVLGIALAGLAVNIVCAWQLSRASGSLNARGAMIHVMGDLLGFARRDHCRRRDHRHRLDADRPHPVARRVRCSSCARRVQLLKQSTGVLMEGVPTHLDYNTIGKALARLPGVTGVHDLHVWNMTAERAALSAHIVLADGTGVAADAGRRAENAGAGIRDRARHAAAGLARACRWAGR